MVKMYHLPMDYIPLDGHKTPHEYVCIHTVIQMASEMVEKCKLTFFIYRFMNLIFIYFSKRGGENYWKGVLFSTYGIEKILL